MGGENVSKSDDVILVRSLMACDPLLLVHTLLLCCCDVVAMKLDFFVSKLVSSSEASLDNTT